MKTMLVSVLLLVAAFGVFGAENFLYVKNNDLISNLKISCVDKDSGVNVEINNSVLRPKETGIVQISSDESDKNFTIKVKSDSVDQELKLKTAKDFFNSQGFVYTDDYSDDNIKGDVKEDYIYQISSIEV